HSVPRHYLTHPDSVAERKPVTDRRTTIYLVRHAESVPSPGVPEPEWPLSERGRSQAEALVHAMRELALHAIYSSPYPRALHTLLPLATALGKQVTVEHALHERV